MHVVVSLGNALHVGSQSCLYEFTELNFFWVPVASQDTKYVDGLIACNPAEILMCYRETVRKVDRLHVWDVARANKAPFAFGIEPRVPFLDKAFLQTSMNIDPQDKMVGYPFIWFLLLRLLSVSYMHWCW